MPRTYSSTTPHANMPRNMTNSRPMPYNKFSGKDRDHDFDRRGHHRHDRNFFAFGFGGYDDYGYYDSCWRWVATAYGWQQVNVCGYPYAYGYGY
jgi:hypothetical protein